MDILGGLLTLLQQLLYFLAQCCFTLFDLAQLMFRLLAGLDTYSLNGTPVEGEIVGGIQLGGSGDLFFQIIKHTFISGDNSYSVIAVAFWSLVILSAILLFVTTIAAMIRSEMNPDKDVPGGGKKPGNSKGKIIWNAIKAILMFAIVPIASYFGIWFGNIMLFVVDQVVSPQTTSLVTIDDTVSQGLQATNGSYNYYIFWGDAVSTSTTSISGIMNRACLYQTNRLRNDLGFYEMVTSTDTPEEGTYNFGIIVQDSQASAAALVDDLFMLNAKLSQPQRLANYDYTSLWGNASGDVVTYFDRSNIPLITYYYDIQSYNSILALAFILTGGKILISLVFAVVNRTITLLALLFLSPITLSFMPLDDGKAFTEWRKKFVYYVISLYILVLLVNLFYIIIPIFNTFTFFSTNLSSLLWADLIIQAVFILAALKSIQSIEKMVSGMLGGGEGLLENASKMASDIENTGKVIGRAAAGTAIAGVHLTGAGVNLAAGATRYAAAGGMSVAGGAHKIRESFSSKRGNTSDDEIKTRVLDTREKNARRDYGDRQAQNLRGSFNDYREHGGRMNQKDFLANTGVGSYVDAMKTSGGDEQALRDYYNNYHPVGNDETFEAWKTEGNNLVANDQALLQSRTQADAVRDTMTEFDGMTQEQYAQNERTKAANAIDSGIAQDDNDADSLKRYNKEVEKRNRSRERAEKEQQSKENAYKLARGYKDRGSYYFSKSKKSLGKSLETIGDTFGKGDKK